MYHTAILEPNEGQIASFIQDISGCLPLPVGFSINKSENIADFYHTEPDLFILSSSAIFPENPEKISCRFFLAPGSIAPQMLTPVSASCIITYGMSGRDSITLSSLDEGGFVLALERELVTLGRRVLDRQELPLKFHKSISEYDFMAALGALLLMDLEAANICSKS